MAAHNPLAAKLAAGAGFDAIWGSGFELSASYAVPDANILSMDIHLEMMRAIGEVQDAPVVADIDTGFGNAVNVAYVIPRYAAAGVAAVVMEEDLPKRQQPPRGRPSGTCAHRRISRKARCGKSRWQRAGHSAHRGIDSWPGPERGTATRRGLCRSWRGWRADSQQTENTGRNPGV